MRRHSTTLGSRRATTIAIGPARSTRGGRAPVVFVAARVAPLLGLPTLLFGWAAVTLLTLAIHWLLGPVTP